MIEIWILVISYFVSMRILRNRWAPAYGDVFGYAFAALILLGNSADSGRDNLINDYKIPRDIPAAIFAEFNKLKNKEILALNFKPKMVQGKFSEIEALVSNAALSKLKRALESSKNPSLATVKTFGDFTVELLELGTYSGYRFDGKTLGKDTSKTGPKPHSVWYLKIRPYESGRLYFAASLAIELELESGPVTIRGIGRNIHKAEVRKNILFSSLRYWKWLLVAVAIPTGLLLLKRRFRRSSAMQSRLV